MTPLSRSLSPLVKRTECLWRLGVFRSFLQGQPDRRSIPGCWKRSFRAVSCGGAGVQPLLKPPEAKQSSASLSSSSSSEGPEDTDKLWSVYKETKRQTEVISTSSVDPDTIFANNEMSLRDIEIYGFDYDYTLAFYSSHLHTLIFNIARDILINNHRYPEGLRKYEYIPDFAVRGLHYDVQKALLMKIDAFHYIQLGTVYRGLHPVPDEEVIAMYEGSHVPLEIMSDFYGKNTVVITTLKMAKRHAYEAQIKLKAISYAEKHGNRAAAREFKINESMVRKWRKMENKLRQQTFPAGVVIKANIKGWMDEEMMKEWLREVYVRRPGVFFPHASPSLLICDSMRAHLTADVKNKVKQMNAVLAVIPGGLTKELQPAVQSKAASCVGAMDDRRRPQFHEKYKKTDDDDFDGFD